MKRQRYRIKPGLESFDVTDGPDAGRRFMRGMTYTELPKGFEARFEPVPDPDPDPEVKPEGAKSGRVKNSKQPKPKEHLEV